MGQWVGPGFVMLRAAGSSPIPGRGEWLGSGGPGIGVSPSHGACAVCALSSSSGWSLWRITAYYKLEELQLSFL